MKDKLMWAAHNIIAHPLMELMTWIGLGHFGDRLHDATCPTSDLKSSDEQWEHTVRAFTKVVQLGDFVSLTCRVPTTDLNWKMQYAPEAIEQGGREWLLEARLGRFDDTSYHISIEGSTKHYDAVFDLDLKSAIAIWTLLVLEDDLSMDKARSMGFKPQVEPCF